MTRFAGYAAVFDRADRSGDVVRKGAFLPLAGPVPLYWQHDLGRIAGTVERLAEDAKGLRVIGRAAGVAEGMGLSFGYRVRAASQGTNRELLKLELVEVSLVAVPMQPLARVHAVEAHADSGAVVETSRPGGNPAKYDFAGTPRPAARGED